MNVAKVHVLIVEDHPDVSSTLGMLLQALGYDVTIAADGHQALELARQAIPDVVLIDIGLPGMDGYQVARALRDEVRLDKSLLVAISGFAPDAARNRQSGFDRHLLKPVRLEMLKSVLAPANVAG